ncbi:hypothetical protein LTR99_005191 [Exophiala xenobiotica]|uniref:Uncharacterized protein n=1 Tax=Vermiconidia calcicola TaxID=1690605 RepID=A0AAV9Q6P0_9PEZI|nr:hypothetical protein LTR99_005191 [Exophiala xenobiotica]KAK5436532.1 hypothetical protein LTR34_002163 [Exophiala xenobiotica]KAK5536051.1 hypothetical protein LTR25_005953 [Vermiconidia calcicola]KAK5541627.1 hypothetical protein LTR23_005716 [Chaetothyriales sp. CCFEE 6169]
MFNNYRARRNGVSKNYRGRGRGRGPSGPISAVPRDARSQAGQPRNVTPRDLQSRITRHLQELYVYRSTGTLPRRPVINYQEPPPDDPGEWADVAEYYHNRVAQEQMENENSDRMDTDPLPEEGVGRHRGPRPPVPKFEWPIPPVPRPQPKPQAEPQYGLTAANHDPVGKQFVENPITYDEPAVAGFSVDDRAMEHFENGQLLKAVIFQYLLDKLEPLFDKVASSTNEGLHEITDQIRIGRTSFFPLLGEREGMCTRYDAVAEVYKNEVNAVVKASRPFDTKLIENIREELQMLKDLCRKIAGPPRKTIGQTGSVAAYCALELVKLAPQEHARHTSWMVDIPSGLDVTIRLVNSALNHSVIKAAIKARSDAGQAAANLLDWLHAAKGDIIRVLNEYESLYRKQKAAFELSIWSSGQDQQKLEDLAILKALHSTLFGPCFQSMGRTVISDLKKRYLPTFGLFVQDRQGWSNLWEPVHRALQKALKLETQDGSLVCPVTEFELASFLELTQEEKDLLAGTDIEDLIDYGEFE